MNKQELLDILDKYLNGSATKQEEELLFAYYDSFQQSEEWNESLSGPSPIIETTLLQRLQQSIQAQELSGETTGHNTPVRRLFTWQKTAAAAAIIILLSAGAWLFLIHTPKSEIAKTENKKTNGENDIAPGGNKAILTLGDNSTIVLDSAADGTLAQQGNVNIIKTGNGQLAYNELNEKPIEVLYNTLTTPRGGQYQLVLPDGSKVWLNAASSIHYPTAFTGAERKVEITGEAYFEVAKNAGMPFNVLIRTASGNSEVKVMGTHFNVNAYDEEAMVKATLLEGSIMITRDAASVVLKPGQQAQLNRIAPIKVLDNADLNEAIAWKNGAFYFENADIQTIMRQVSRWYDVEVVYEGKIPSGHYKGKPSMHLTAAQMLKIVEYSGVKFRIEGRKIIISE